MGRAAGLTHNMQTSSGSSLAARRACSTCCRCTAFRGRTSLRGARRARGDGTQCQNATGRVFLPAFQHGSCKECPCAAAWTLRAPIAFLQLLALFGEDSRCLVSAARQRHAGARGLGTTAVGIVSSSLARIWHGDAWRVGSSHLLLHRYIAHKHPRRARSCFPCVSHT